MKDFGTERELIDRTYEFTPSSSQVSFVRLPKDDGIEPVSKFDRTLRYWRFFRAPRAAGSDPESCFRLAKSSLWRYVSFAKAGEIVPASCYSTDQWSIRRWLCSLFKDEQE